VAQGEAASEKRFVEEMVRRLEERGVDVNDLLIGALSKEDPQGSARLRLDLAERSLAKTKEYVRKGDAVQASEKGCRDAEEVVKALAERLDMPEHGQAVKEGRWYARLLASAAAKLPSGLGRRVAEGWGRWL